MTYDIAGPAGRLEARLDEPGATTPHGTPRAVAVLAAPHPQLGGTFQDRVVYQLAQGLLRSGCAVLRFNFRGVGRSAGAFGNGEGEQDDFRAVVNDAATRFPGLPIWAGGYSFGAYVAMTVGATDDRVTLLLGVAPLVNTYDFSTIVGSSKPKFLIQAEQDELCPPAVLRRFYATLAEPRELVIIDGANHVFDGHASEIADAVEDLVSDFEEPPNHPEGGVHHV